jgi:CDP-glycerol glycerophosphotransferase (TagB/SpsB family)
VTAPGTEPHLLRSTLQSARNQQTPELEIIVVCLDEQARRVAEAVAGDDTRVRILDAATVQAARRLGVRRGKGRLVVLAAPGDVYPLGAIVAALAVAADRLVVLAQPADPPGPNDLEQAPSLAGTARLGRLVLADVDAEVLDVLEEDGDADGVRTAARLLRQGFVVTDRPAYEDARSAGLPPFSVRADPLPRLGARIARDRAALAALEGLDQAGTHLAAGALAALRPFLEAGEAADADVWETLSGHARDLVGIAGDRLDVLDVVPRAMARLAADGRRDELVALVAARRFAGDDFPTTVADGQVYADLGVSLTEADLKVAARESGLRAYARRLRVVDDRLEIEVLAGLRHVDQVNEPRVTAALVDGDDVRPLEARVAADPAVDRWLAETEHDHQFGRITLSIPVSDLVPSSWQIGLNWETEGLRRAGVVEGLDVQGSAARARLTAGAHAVRLRELPGGVRVRIGAPVAHERGDVEAVEVGATGMHLTVRGDVDQVWLDGSGTRVDAVRQHHRVWAVPLSHDVWGLGERPLPSGGYRLHLERAGIQQPARLAPALIDRLPEETRTAGHRLRLQRGDGDGLVVRLEPRLADDEAGPRAQRVLQQEYAGVTEPLDERLVYFQSFTGQWANDHPLAIQQELARRRPDLRVRWAVADSSAPVPEGAEPVLVRSRAWYDVLARAGHIVTNIELERWFRRRPGQQILQTFHGYPSKTMGLGLWRSRGLLPSHLEQQLDHTSRTWNALLTPDLEMDRYYREEYAYDGRILALGYPRDDVLVGPDRQQIRDDTRHRLGIAPGQRAVLYAPTWRDDLATNFRAAEAVHHLDVAQAAAMLGDDYVLLLRGHRFHAGAATAGRVVDVTTYPDVNDLILAADVAVLDYSSMRFDFALTGRPMVFLVPDLDDYESRTRGFLWDFGETAPGPWVRDTAGVVAELRDIDALERRCAERMTAFNDRYNSLQDGHAAERVVEDFFADLPPAG